MKKLLFLSLLTSTVWACPTGYENHEGVCAAMPAPSQADAAIIDTKTYVSDEKPPRNPQPAWERGEVHADIGTHTSTAQVQQDYKSEKEQQ